MASSETNLLVFGFLLAALLLVSTASATSRELAEKTAAGGDRVHPEHDGYGDGYHGGYNGGGYNGGYNGGHHGGGGGGGGCQWGCCHRGYRGGCRCCSSPNEVPDAEYQAEPGQ